jgi:aminoglycoside/choline kinase family phosphotransferase
MLDRYMEGAGIEDRDAFLADYAVLGAQRHAKVLGIFTRLWKRDGKPHYRRFQPRMWGLLERDLAQPGLAPVRAWFDDNIAPEHRREPWSEAA